MTFGENAAGSEFYNDSHERLQAVQRAIGLPELSEVELRHADHGAQLLMDVFFYDLGSGWPDDSPEHRIADGLSVETINAWNSYRRKRDSYGPSGFKSLGPMPTTHSERVWRKRRSIADLDNPFREPRPLCIVAASPKKAYPLDRFEDWKLVSFDIMGPCDVRISADCHKSTALLTTPLVRGEFVTAHKVCNPCYRWPFAYSAEAVEMFKDILVEHHVEPTNVDRKAQLLLTADTGVL